MARATAARCVARELVSACRRRQARVHDIARKSSTFTQLSPRDRAFALWLASGTLASYGAMRPAAEQFVRRPGSLEPRVADALALSSYELCYAATPTSAAVSQGVELVRALAPAAGGLANAVLRRVAAEVAPQVRTAVAALEEGDPSGITTKVLIRASSLPAWLVEQLTDERGQAWCANFARALLQPAPTYVALNQMRSAGRSLSDVLDEAGLAWQPAALAGCAQVDDAAALVASGLAEQDICIVADEGAQIVCRCVAPAAGLSLLEVGQGRASKTILLANLAREQGGVLPIVGIDVLPYKVRVARERLERAGITEATSLVFDGTQLDSPALPAPLDRTFHQVFVDAPCSGVGTLRRHPEIAWSLTPEALDPADTTSLPALQAALLSAAAARVEPEGVLTYSVCSPLKVECEQVIARFLASEVGQDFARVSALEATSAGDRRTLAPMLLPTGELLVAPQPAGPDVHFVCRLRRT